MGADNRVVLFALSTCPACRKAKTLLENKGVDYLCVELDTVDLDSRGKLLEKVRKYNARETFPTMVLEGGKRVVVGFSEEEIIDALKDCGILMARGTESRPIQ